MTATFAVFLAGLALNHGLQQKFQAVSTSVQQPKLQKPIGNAENQTAFPRGVPSHPVHPEIVKFGHHLVKLNDGILKDLRKVIADLREKERKLGTPGSQSRQIAEFEASIVKYERLQERGRESNMKFDEWQRRGPRHPADK